MFSIGVIHTGDDLVCQIEKSLFQIIKIGTFPISEVAKISPLLINQERQISDWSKHRVYFVDNSIGCDTYTRFRTVIGSQNSSKVILAVTDPSTLSSFLGLDVCPNAVLYDPIINRDIENILHRIHCETKPSIQATQQSHFYLKSSGSYIAIPLSDIMFFESRGKQVALKTLGREYLFYANFDDVNHQLDDRFVRSHKGFIINIQHVSVADFKVMNALMRDHSLVPIARLRKDAVKLRLQGKLYGE